MPGKKFVHVRDLEAPHGNTSAGGRWLRQRYAKLKDRLAVRWPPYAEVAAEMAEAGIMGGGHPPRPLSVKAVRKMWRRVELDVLHAERRAAARPARAELEVVAPGWKPEVVRAAVARPTPASDEPADEEVEAKLARLWADVDKRSGRG